MFRRVVFERERLCLSRYSSDHRGEYESGRLKGNTGFLRRLSTAGSGGRIQKPVERVDMVVRRRNVRDSSRAAPRHRLAEDSGLHRPASAPSQSRPAPVSKQWASTALTQPDGRLPTPRLSGSGSRSSLLKPLSTPSSSLSRTLQVSHASLTRDCRTQLLYCSLCLRRL